jgi:pimeloyl-ACP methyl ester carboxylesterase
MIRKSSGTGESNGLPAVRERRLELAGYRTRALELDPVNRHAGPALVLLHGFPDSVETWRRLLARLARRSRCVLAVDMPGFGRASRLDRNESILPQLDRFAAAAIDRQAGRSSGGEVVVAGNSLGGCVALRAAERTGLPLAGIVAIAPAGLTMARWLSIIEGEPLVRLMMRVPIPLPEVVVREAVGRVYRMLAFAHPGEVDAGIVRALTSPVRTRRDAGRGLATGRRLMPELRDPFACERIRSPVLLVWGDSDRMVFPASAERLLGAVPGSRTEVIEGGGDCPQIEQPERLAELLDEFPAQLARAA